MEQQVFTSYVNVAALISAGMLIGMLIGYMFARGGQRRIFNSQSDRDREELSTMRDEYDDYRDRVEVHFRETSEVFQKTTEQYRALYQQIATGAVELCDPQAVEPILATARSANDSLTGVAAVAATTQFPRESQVPADERLGSALAEMRAEMNELDSAINDLREDVIVPKREAMNDALTADTITRDALSNSLDNPADDNDNQATGQWHKLAADPSDTPTSQIPVLRSQQNGVTHSELTPTDLPVRNSSHQPGTNGDTAPTVEHNGVNGATHESNDSMRRNGLAPEPRLITLPRPGADGIPELLDPDTPTVLER